MPRGILLVTGLALFSTVLAQGQTTTPSTTATPVNGQFGGPMLVTPSTSFPNHVPTAGISDAGRAGISNATNEMETTTAPATPSASPSESTNVSESTNQTPVPDLGPSTFVGGAAEESAPSTISLAEVSSRYKAEKGTRNARVLSNDDVQTMLNNKSGVTMAKNMPPLGPGTLEQRAPAQNAGVAQTSQPSQSSTPGTSASSGQSQTAATNSAENSTTPQINRNQQSNDAQGSRRLPATATFLPLLGLLGLLSGGIGFWFRKFRN
jgi:hypothetical protein